MKIRIKTSVTGNVHNFTSTRNSTKSAKHGDIKDGEDLHRSSKRMLQNEAQIRFDCRIHTV